MTEDDPEGRDAAQPGLSERAKAAFVGYKRYEKVRTLHLEVEQLLSDREPEVLEEVIEGDGPAGRWSYLPPLLVAYAAVAAGLLSITYYDDLTFGLTYIAIGLVVAPFIFKFSKPERVRLTLGKRRVSSDHLVYLSDRLTNEDLTVGLIDHHDLTEAHVVLKFQLRDWYEEIESHAHLRSKLERDQ